MMATLLQNVAAERTDREQNDDKEEGDEHPARRRHRPQRGCVDLAEHAVEAGRTLAQAAVVRSAARALAAVPAQYVAGAARLDHLGADLRQSERVVDDLAGGAGLHQLGARRPVARGRVRVPEVAVGTQTPRLERDGPMAGRGVGAIVGAHDAHVEAVQVGARVDVGGAGHEGGVLDDHGQRRRRERRVRRQVRLASGGVRRRGEGHQVRQQLVRRHVRPVDAAGEHRQR